MPFEKGNQHAANARKWRAAIDKALKKRSKVGQFDALIEIADKLLEAAMKGDQWAIKELGDRIDGKSAQAINVGGQEDNPLLHKITREIVTPNTNS